MLSNIFFPVNKNDSYHRRQNTHMPKHDLKCPRQTMQETANIQGVIIPNYISERYLTSFIYQLDIFGRLSSRW
jgi:hypothetical protein